MSTRYVWGKFGLITTYVVNASESGGHQNIYASESDIYLYDGSGRITPTNSPSYVRYAILTSDELLATLAGNTTTMQFSGQCDFGDSIRLPSDSWVFFSTRDISALTNQPLPIYGYWNTSFGTKSIRVEKSSNRIYGYAQSGEIVCYAFRGKKAQDDKGSLVSDVSGTSQSSYPSDGVKGSYWYTYQGSDNIDPSACSIPSTINGGTAITITVTPGIGKVYGGTVSYQYQVNIGSGWQTIATTSATSRSYTVPYGTASIQVRVRAQDNIGFTSSTYVTSSSVTVINNQPPTAPGSIEVTNVIAGQTATITLTAATDPDGTIASYIYERSVDGSAWTQIANVNSLTQTDTISADWGTVAYRAKAVDDDGASGPYVTSSTTVVNSGWVIISGPAADMGSQPKPFNFTITPSISGTTTSDQITVDVTLDGNSIYNEAVAPGTEIELEIDTRLMRTGDHAIAVSATCASFLPAANEYSFSVPVIAIPDGGRMDQLEGPDGQVIFPITLARAVAGLENYSVESKVHPGAYTGSGTYGSGNPNSLALEFEPKLVIIQGTSGRMAVLIKPSGVGISIGASDSTTLNVTWDGESVSWYNGVNAANQMNTSNETYSYTAFG